MEPGELKAAPPLVTALRDISLRSTAEVRVHLSRWGLEKDIHSSAHRVFQLYGMHRTSEQNAILIYVNIRKKRFALIGGAGIDEKAGRSFWADCSSKLSSALRSSPLDTGLTQFARYLADQLEHHFPRG